MFKGFLPGLVSLAVVLCATTSAAAPKTPEQKSKSRAAEAASSLFDAKSGMRLLLSGKYLHFSCARSVRDLEKNRFECFGNVYLRRPSELLTADYIVMDLNSQQLRAEGNVVYFTPDTVIYGASMEFNFVSETGTVFDGRVDSDKYQLLGERIERLGPGHYRATDGEYTTCRDCPASWKLVGRSVDLTVNGYAKMSDVFIKINESPILYIPYAIIPVKTRRQSGLLFPEIQLASSNGFTFVQPYFWAISRNMDATLGAGYYTRNGVKGELEYRYILSERSSGQFNGFYLNDTTFAERYSVPERYENRWAMDYRHNLDLPWKMAQKLVWLDVSDRDYIRRIGDIPGQTGEPALVSEASLSRSGRDVSAWASVQRIRNLLTPKVVGFDSSTVQLLPSASLATTDHRIVERVPLYWGLSGNYARFWRTEGGFDPLDPVGQTLPAGTEVFTPGVTPLRRGQRFTLTPELYFTANIFDVIDFTPSVQYRAFHYLFDDNLAPSTNRGYLLAQAEVATTIERVYAGTVKHKFRPSLTYSNIPIIRQDEDHPFIRQIETAGYQFDQTDIVPIDYADAFRYFTPLGNSLTYRLNNRFVLKEAPATKDSAPTYRRAVEITSGQSINFREYKKSAEEREPFSRFFTTLTVDTVRMQATGEYAYYPYLNVPTYALQLSYYFAKYSRRLLTFERSVSFNYSKNHVTTNSNSIGGGFNWSINDNFSILGGISYAFPVQSEGIDTPGYLLAANGGLTYQSPSQCYKVVLAAGWKRENPTVEVSVNFPINLTGEGFADFQDGGAGFVPGAAAAN